tara:strand:- start:7767 stop:8678 length:912 start_codon:yes stop_codon:yes gene_type:complete
MLWTEKYRPQFLNEIVGQSSFVLDAEQWVKNKSMPNVLLFGVAGTGKTAAAGALANEMLTDYKQSNFFEINASDDRKLESVRTQIKEIASTSKIGDAPFKIILLDEMDGMTKDAQNALKRIMERYADNCRFIITCNERHKIIYPLQSRCANYQFNRLSDENIRFILEQILSQEKQETPDIVEMEAFIGGLHGDIRRGITELQASIFSDSPLSTVTKQSLEPYSEIIQMILENKHTDALDKLHSMVYQITDMKTICVNLHDAVLDTKMTHTKKFQLLKVIGEAEWRSRSTTPKLLCSWLIGQTQ